MRTQTFVGTDGKVHRFEISDETVAQLGIETETVAAQTERLYRERQRLKARVDEAERQTKIAVLTQQLNGLKIDLEAKKAEEARQAMPEPEFYLDDNLMREAKRRHKEEERRKK